MGTIATIDIIDADTGENIHTLTTEYFSWKANTWYCPAGTFAASSGTWVPLGSSDGGVGFSASLPGKSGESQIFWIWGLTPYVSSGDPFRKGRSGYGEVTQAGGGQVTGSFRWRCTSAQAGQANVETTEYQEV